MIDNDAVKRVEVLAHKYFSMTDISRYLEHGPIWEQRSWSKILDFAELEAFEFKSGERVSRKLIHEAWENAQNDEDVYEAFFLTMVWGFGNHYLGPWKMKKMINSIRIARAVDLLFILRDAVQIDNLSAFETVLSAKISQLGPVYASKLLYAMSPENRRSPVMDMWVGRWGARFNLDIKVDSTKSIESNLKKMSDFTSFCNRSLEHLQDDSKFKQFKICDAGFIEYLIFWDAKAQFRKPWMSTDGFPSWLELGKS